MGRKPVVKAKAKAKAEPVVAEPEEDAATIADREARRVVYLQRKEAQKWADASLATVRKLVEGAKDAKLNWLEVAHEFHEVRLIRFVKRLADKEKDEAPKELQDGLAAYVAQCASGGYKTEVQQDSFKYFQDIWDVADRDANAYVRAQETPEAVLAIDRLKAWTDCNAQGTKELTGLMQTHISSAGAQQAGLTRIGFLFNEAASGKKAEGFSAQSLMPCIQEAMSKHLADPEVQRFGCSALRGLAMAEGQLPLLCDANGVELIVEALKAHYKVTDVCSTANGAVWAMAERAGRNSPEVTRMRTAGMTEVLLKVMTHHAWDQTLCGKIRVTLPFIQED